MDVVPSLETSIRLALFLGVLLIAGIGFLSLFRAWKSGGAANFVGAAVSAGVLVAIVVVTHFRW